MFSGLPTLCDMHTYREKISLGFTTLSRAQVDKKLALLEDEWTGDSYDMVGARAYLPVWLPACLRTWSSRTPRVSVVMQC